jgi:hypothetical protein
MSVAHTTPAPAAPAAPVDKTTALRWIGGSATLAAALAALAIAVWPASEADKARADGEQLGQAVSSLYAADTSAEVDDALAEIHAAAIDTRDHAGDAVADQVAETEDALYRAADGFVGMHTADDSFTADVYEYELDEAVSDLDQQREDVSTDAPEVEQAFWDGYETGLAGE